MKTRKPSPCPVCGEDIHLGGFCAKPGVFGSYGGKKGRPLIEVLTEATVAEALNVERVAQGLSYNALARRCDLFPSKVHDILTGRTRNPGIMTVKTILRGLGRDLPWLHKATTEPENLK